MREVQALSAARAAFLAEPVVQPALPSTDIVLEAMQEPIRDAVRVQMEPLLRAFRTDIEELLRAHSEELQGTIWQKIVKSMRMAELVLAWIEGVDKAGLDELRASSAT